MSGLRSAALGAAGLLGMAGPAFAHGAERGFVMLLPTGHVMTASAAAVAASFVAIALVPAEMARRAAAATVTLGTVPAPAAAVFGTLSAILLFALILSGQFGTRDPLMNPLVLAVWTVFWIGLPLVHALFGNLWAVINPFSGPVRLLDRATGGAVSRAQLTDGALLRAGHLPAIVLFFAFAWFELVYPAPDDPEHLATVVAVYAVLTYALVITYGDAWLQRGDPFSVFFRFVARLSPLVGRTDFVRRSLTVSLTLPGAGLAGTAAPPGTGTAAMPGTGTAAMPIAGVVFVLTTLGTVSFDGLSKTFTYVAAIGVNPLEYPGRSAVIAENTVGLVLAVSALALLYFGSIYAGWRLAGRPGRFAEAAGRFVFAIVPISIAFHLSHYLTALLINGQYALLALNDPFGTGADLLGRAGTYVSTSFLASAEGSTRIFAIQTAVIVIGHVMAVIAAHLTAAEIAPGRRGAALLELPLTLLMVGYTVFGLWLLSTPTVG